MTYQQLKELENIEKRADALSRSTIEDIKESDAAIEALADMVKILAQILMGKR